MSAKYNPERYNKAEEEFKTLSDAYNGEKGINWINAQGSKIAANTANRATKNAIAAANSSGMSKSQSALGGMAVAADTAAATFQNGVNIAMQKQQNDLASKQNLMAGAQNVDDKNYQAKKDNQSAWTSAIGSALGAGAQLGAAAIGKA